MKRQPRREPSWTGSRDPLANLLADDNAEASFRASALDFIGAPKSGQHQNMRTQDSMRAGEANQTPSPLFPAARITKLLLDLKASLGQAEGQPLSYDEWAQIAGRPANTIASWCAGGAAHQL